MNFFDDRRGAFSLEMSLAVLITVIMIGGCFNLARYLLATASIHSALVEVARCMRMSDSDCSQAPSPTVVAEARALAVVRRSFPLVTNTCGADHLSRGGICLELTTTRHQDSQSLLLRLELPLLFPLDVLLANEHISVGAAARMPIHPSTDGAFDAHAGGHL